MLNPQDDTTVRHPHPTVAVVFMQPACNMHCTFCVTEDNFDVMMRSQAEALLTYLKMLGVKSLVIGGGEPFDWPGDLISISQYAKQLGFRTVQVGTNGIALPDGFENIESIDRFVISIESAHPAPHNAMRLYQNRHHDIIMNRLDKLKEAKKSVTLSTVITEVNKNAILQLAEFIHQHNEDSHHVHAWHLYQFIPVGRGGVVHGDDLRIEPEEYDAIVESVKALNLPFKIYRRSDMYASQTVDFFWYHHGEIKRGSEIWNQPQPAQ